jgi:hypothetical protein
MTFSCGESLDERWLSLPKITAQAGARRRKGGSVGGVAKKGAALGQAAVLYHPRNFSQAKIL